MSAPDTKSAQQLVGFCIGERPKGDFYSTPAIAIEKLLEVESFGNLIWEPACGNGAISKILENKYKVISTDLYDWGYGQSGIDFLKEPPREVDAVVTNPPFKEAINFAYRAIETTQAKSGKVAMLCRLQWLEGIKRKKLFTETPFSKVLIFSKRIPRLNRFDYTGPQGSNLMAFAWFIWDHNHKGKPIIEWI